jgi:four helix bundle protein
LGNSIGVENGAKADLEGKLKARTKRFALDVLRAVKGLPRDPYTVVLGRQLLRSATAIGANYRSACRARSHPDFVSKISITEEEADETQYWLELLLESGHLPRKDFEGLQREATELVAIFTASSRTARSRR